jgi:hypothetical protein
MRVSDVLVGDDADLFVLVLVDQSQRVHVQARACGLAAVHAERLNQHLLLGLGDFGIAEEDHTAFRPVLSVFSLSRINVAQLTSLTPDARELLTWHRP